LYALTPNPSPRGRGEPIHPSGSLSHRERSRVRAFGVLAEKFCQSIRGQVIGFEKLNFLPHFDSPVRVAFETVAL